MFDITYNPYWIVVFLDLNVMKIGGCIGTLRMLNDFFFLLPKECDSIILSKPWLRILYKGSIFHNVPSEQMTTTTIKILIIKVCFILIYKRMLIYYMQWSTTTTHLSINFQWNNNIILILVSRKWGPLRFSLLLSY